MARHKKFSKKKIGEIEKIDEKKLKKYLHLNKKKFGEKLLQPKLKKQ